MHTNTLKNERINEKLLIAGAGLLLFAMALPSIFILAKVAVGLAMLALGIIAFKVTLKAMLNTLGQGETDKNHTTRNKIINIAIGLTSVLIGGLSLLILAKTGLIAVCAAFTALVLHECFKSEEKEVGKKSESAHSNGEYELVGMEEESEPVQNEKKSGCLDEKFNKIAGDIVTHTTSFIVSSIEALTPSKTRQA